MAVDSGRLAWFVRRITGTATLKGREGEGAAELVLESDTNTLRYYAAGAVRALMDTWNTQTVTGAKTFSGAATFTAATTGLRGSFETTDADTDTLTTAESGTVFLCTKSSATQTFTLPATVAGVTYTFVAGHADGEINLSPNAADKITGKGIGGADDGDIKNTAGTNAVGDAVTIVGDGADGWVITSMLGTWATV